jgi:hypothetical protein
MAKHQNQITTLVSSHRKWLNDNSERIWQREMRYIEQDLAERSVGAMLNVSDSLARLATLYGIRGTIGVLDGNSSGYEYLGRSLSYHYDRLKLRIEAFFKAGHREPNLTNNLSRLASILCYAIASGSSAWLEYSARTLSVVSRDASALDEGCWDQRLFEPFALALEHYKRQREWPSGDTARNMGPFSRILVSWRGDTLSDSVVAVCDYHCQNMMDSGGGDNEEFKYPPFDLFPVEVLAISKVRTDAGIVDRAVEHPLLRTPLADPEKIPVPSDDDTLQQVRQAASNILSE